MALAKYLAFDLGAESGRAIVGILDGNKIALEEIYRFPTKQIKLEGLLHWDILELLEEIKKGMTLAVGKGYLDIDSIGIDTWGVDFGFIGKNNNILNFPYTYRDARTGGVMEKVFEYISRAEIYEKTGIQFMQINSLYQLYSLKLSEEKLFSDADKLLFMPDLFNFFLTGIKRNEYTIASTSQMLNANKKLYDEAIFSKLNIPIDIMPPIIMPGQVVGKLLPQIADEVGLNEIDIVAVGCHDTASAIAAVPVSEDNWAYLSSGTWSLIGIETTKPIINDFSLQNNFTNEGGVSGSILFLQNVMGLWLLQETRKSWKQHGEDYQYDELIKMASESEEFKCIIDPDDITFLNPVNMPKAIIKFCERTNQSRPETKGEFIRCIFESLALKYKNVIDNINLMIGEKIRQLHIVGGGSQNEMLNQFTANALGIPVIAGPVEATAIGNVLMQAISKGRIGSIKQGREMVVNSFPLKIYNPKKSQHWNKVNQLSRRLITNKF